MCAKCLQACVDYVVLVLHFRVCVCVCVCVRVCVVCVYEAPGLPPQSVTITVHDSHSMTVTWMPPSSEHNGVIIGYNVNVTLAYSLLLPVQYFTNSTSFHLEGLTPHSTYHVEVAAVTVAIGPYSEYVYAIIPEDGELLFNIVPNINFYRL